MLQDLLERACAGQSERVLRSCGSLLHYRLAHSTISERRYIMTGLTFQIGIIRWKAVIGSISGVTAELLLLEA